MGGKDCYQIPSLWLRLDGETFLCVVAVLVKNVTFGRWLLVGLESGQPRSVVFWWLSWLFAYFFNVAITGSVLLMCRRTSRVEMRRKLHVHGTFCHRPSIESSRLSGLQF